VLEDLGLPMYDLHAPVGVEKNWVSAVEYRRRAGVEIIKNRVEMCRTLGGSVVVTHIPEHIAQNLGDWCQLKTSFAELEGFCAHRGVRIAVENRPSDDFAGILELFAEYGSNYLGLCYDSGHGNIGGAGLAHLASVQERLISVHLHDNDGVYDQHKPVFTGTIDREALARIVAEFPYRGLLTFETDMKFPGFEGEHEFLAATHRDGPRLREMIRGAVEASA
jgi:sugar phosphate isomerase/epimerase